MSKTGETYVPLSRGIVDHLKFIKGMPLTIYIFLLAEAKFTGENKGIVKRKIRDIASELEIDYKTTHTALTKLKKLKYITIKTAKNQHSLTEFKILKYKTVSDFLKKEQHPNSPQADTQATTQATPEATEKQRKSTVKNDNNITDLQDHNNTRIKEVKNKPLFNEFWAAYPKKKNKGQAEKAWNKIKPDKILLSRMISTLSWLKNSNEWIKNGGKYIPNPATWLNAKGWEDEPLKLPQTTRPRIVT
jgi:hypothetical protein